MLGCLSLEILKCAVLRHVEERDATHTVVKSNRLLFIFQSTKKVDIGFGVVMLGLRIHRECRVATYCLHYFFTHNIKIRDELLQALGIKAGDC